MSLKRAGAPGWLFPLLIIIVETAYLPVVGNGFVNWDDPANFINNRDFRGFSSAQVKWAWSTSLLGVYQSLAWMLLEVEYVVWGLDPRWYHIASFVLHSINSVVLYHLISFLLIRCNGVSTSNSQQGVAIASALACASFAVHPLRVEAVAWASCQPYLPSSLFAMLSVLAYFRAVDRGGWSVWWYLASVSLFATALLCKAAAIALPAALVILDYYPIRRLSKAAGGWTGRRAGAVLADKLPFVAIAVWCGKIALDAKASAVVFGLKRSDGAYPRIAQACHGTLFYIYKTLLPIGLSAFYPSPESISASDPYFLGSVLVVICISLLAIVVRRRLPGLFAAWFCYLLFLAPSSGIVTISRQIAADRYSYMASISLAVLMAFSLSRVLQRRGHVRLTAAVSVSVLAVLAGLTWRQCLTWRSSEALWQNALQCGGVGVPEVYYNLSSAVLSERTDRNRGMELLFAARDPLLELLAQTPSDVLYNNLLGNTYNNMGMAMLDSNRPKEALLAFENAVRCQRVALNVAPDKAPVRSNLVDHLLNVSKAGRALKRTDIASDAAWELRLICEGEPFGLYMGARGKRPR